jgi:DNA-binding response OmpR family regulator
LRAGADDLVSRPFGLRELTMRVRILLRHTEAAVSAGLDAGLVDLGRVRADLAGRRLLQGDRVLPLRPRAFALLAFFIAHPGQVFSREDLLERVWGDDAATGTRTVDVHVHWLRQRIEEDAAHPVLLQTVRGMGYVFRRPG